MDQSTQESLCIQCGQVKPAGEFHRNRARKNGLLSRCKECVKARLNAPGEAREKRLSHKREATRQNRALGIGVTTLAYRRAWAAANPEKVREQTRRWAKAHPDKVSEGRQRYRARRKAAAVEGVVDVAALWTGICALCAQPIDRALRGPDPMSRSLDHIVPLCLGGTHSQGNLQWTHLVCNWRKGGRAP